MLYDKFQNCILHIFFHFGIRYILQLYFTHTLQNKNVVSLHFYKTQRCLFVTKLSLKERRKCTKLSLFLIKSVIDSFINKYLSCFQQSWTNLRSMHWWTKEGIQHFFLNFFGNWKNRVTKLSLHKVGSYTALSLMIFFKANA